MISLVLWTRKKGLTAVGAAYLKWFYSHGPTFFIKE